MATHQVHQFADIPQIPSFGDESQYAGWGNEQNYYMHVYRHHAARPSSIPDDDIEYNRLNNHGILSMQPMQRFLLDPSPLTPGLLHAKLDTGLPLQSQHLRQYERQWPSADCFRNGSPDRTSVSGNSSYATQNELRSPHIYHSVPYGSPSELSQPYPSAESFNEGGYLLDPPLSGGSISLREIEYEHQEPEPEPTIEESDHTDMKPEPSYDPEPIYTKMDTTPDDYKSYADSGIGNSVRDAESVEPMPQEGDSDDSDYKPSGRKNAKSSKRRQSTTSTSSSGRNGQRKRVNGGRNVNASTSANTSRVNKRTRGSHSSPNSMKVNDTTKDTEQRPFPCPLAPYGCQSTFSSKNEWKRHVSTQHIKLGFWRCDLCLTTVDPNDDHTIYHNDFNRKDLFTQHLRRMHAAPAHQSSRGQKEYQVTEDNLPGHQKRCYQILRSTPQQSACLFCDRIFSGPNSWDERMEHVGRHLEKDRKQGFDLLDITTWNKDEGLERYLLQEGLIEIRHGEWKIGDGKPKRHSVLDNEESSEEEA